MRRRHCWDYPEHMAAKVRVLVVDDEAFVRTTLGALVESLDYDALCVANAADANEAIDSFDPHVVICDLDLGPGPTGVDVLRSISRKSPWVARIVLSSHRSPRLVDADGRGIGKDTIHLTKKDLHSAEQLHHAIEAALNGERFALSTTDDPVLLTKDQAAVLRMVAEGMSNEAIAQARGTQVRAVEKVLRRIYNTLGLETVETTNARVPAARMYRESAVDVK